MTDIEVKTLFKGDYVSAESCDTQPHTSPIYFKGYLNGSYITVEKARLLISELAQAIAAVEDDAI